MCTVDCFVPEYNAMVEVHLPVYANMDSSDIICLFQRFKDATCKITCGCTKFSGFVMVNVFEYSFVLTPFPHATCLVSDT